MDSQAGGPGRQFKGLGETHVPLEGVRKDRRRQQEGAGKGVSLGGGFKFGNACEKKKKRNDKGQLFPYKEL